MDLLKKPTTDFAAVRDGRNSLPLWMDIDLTNARGIAAGSALSINIAGNSFYVDQDTTNVGNATVHFQDTNLGASSAPLFVSAGFIANVPFTQILIENTAQAGKRLRIFYGVDIDFQAGVNASITISGTITTSRTSPLSVDQIPSVYGASYKSVTAMAANTPDTVFTPAANANGAIIHRINGFSATGAAVWTQPTFIAKASAPATVIDGDIIAMMDSGVWTGAGASNLKLEKPIFIPAGKGLYYIANAAETLGQRSVLYTLL